MKKEEKALLKDIAGMIDKLVEMSEKEENQQQAAEKDNCGGYKEESDINSDDVEFVKKLTERNIVYINFVALLHNGRFAEGLINKLIFNAMCKAFLEKYA